MESMQIGEGRPLEVAVVQDDGTTPRDLTGATALLLRIKKPGQAATNVTALVTGLATAGVLQYAQPTGVFIDAPGTWKMQALYTLGGVPYKTAVGRFKVERNLV